MNPKLFILCNMFIYEEVIEKYTFKEDKALYRLSFSLKKNNDGRMFVTYDNQGVTRNFVSSFPDFLFNWDKTLTPTGQHFFGDYS